MVFNDQSTTLGGLLACSNKYATADDDNREDLDSRRKSQPSKKSGDEQAGPSTEVAASFGKGGQNSDNWRNKKPAEERQSRPPKITWEMIMDEPCAHHLKVNGKVTHTNRQCHINREAAKHPGAGKPRNKRKARKDDKEKEESTSKSGEASPKQ